MVYLMICMQDWIVLLQVVFLILVLVLVLLAIESVIVIAILDAVLMVIRGGYQWKVKQSTTMK